MITKSIPSILTLGNLCLGVISIMLVFNERSGMAAIMIIIAMLLDGVDGRVARALNAQSEFGKELDSLADVISFGVAPAFIMYVVALQDVTPMLSWFVTALFPICGALRLARFNVKSSSPGHFIGLPIPAAGGILATVALFKGDVSPIVFIITSIVLALLMVSNIRYPSFKRIGIPKSAVWVIPIIVIVALVIGIMFEEHLSKIFFIPLILYALYGLKKNVRRRSKRKQQYNIQEEEQSEKHA
ncbi:CDP-diacylglycerol--serine O-phosphatidyltransferase [Paenibacillus endoradicis]|uniref:CDP-diacylglycerol--serine O-phosphatidyltransferase n=1 Tax=Paenibacillus endoradicis TaxID=2972487 RepID=UPI0021595161|nr:CDP-diacylglycerol--serine O-phosphatidyltransferase [Paenibacillus endoradicis]MCR8660747.1 CDP-diacylglycerol--serine O-phosphatidyltransferase [Paenibacillus endoradicis]